MEQVSAEAYMNRDREVQRFYQDENQRAETPFLVKAGVGIAVAAGVLSAAHRTGAMRKIARHLDTQTRATKEAWTSTWQEQGQLFRGEDKLTLERMSALKKGFFEKRDERVAHYTNIYTPAGILETRTFDMEKALQKRQQLIGKKVSEGVYEGDVAYHIQESFRFDAVMNEAKNHTFFQKNQDLFPQLQQAITNGQLGVLDYGSMEQLKLLLNRQGKGLENNKDALNALMEAREKYQGRNFTPNSEEAFKAIEEMQKRVGKFTAEQITNATRQQGVIKDVVIGHKQATVQDILDLHAASKIRINKDLEVQLQDVLKKNKEFAHAVFDENLYLSTKNGELFDYQSFSTIKRNTAEWWANTIPGGLLHLRDILNVKTAREEAGIKIFQRGVTLSSLNAHRGFEVGQQLDHEVLFAYGKFIKLHDREAIASETAATILNPTRDMYLTSSSFGTMGKMQRHVSNMMTEDKDRGIVTELFDLGNQDKDSVGIQAVSMFTKFFKKDWEPNRIKSAIQNGLKTPEDFFALNTYFQLNTQGFTPRVLNQLKGTYSSSVESFIKKEINGEAFDFSKDEHIIELFKEIGAIDKLKTSSPHTELKTLYRQFERDPDSILYKKTPIGESNPLLGHHTRVKTGIDEIRQQTSLYLLSERMLSQSTDRTFMPLAERFRTELKGLHQRGKIWTTDLEQAEELVNYSIFRSQGFDIFQNRDQTLNRVSRLFQTNSGFQDSMIQMSKRTNPWWERFSSSRPENLVGDPYVVINESSVGKVFTQPDKWNSIKQVGREINPFTGRNNLEDVSTLSLFGTYYPVYRLQDALGNIGLGFSDASMGSAAQMFSSLFLKRLLPVYAGVEAVKYADWKVDQLTGEGLDERWENYKANDRLDKAYQRTEEELYQLRRARSLKPGIEHFEAMPEIHLPGIGPVGPGDFLNLLSAPLAGYAPLHKEDLLSYEETLDDLYTGVEEQRKSRWWFMGSKSAYRGDRVTEFAPNSFRQAHSDWEWSNTGATGEEYFGNHLLPNPENPLGFLSFALGLRDPYWYEKKHYYDRPYLLTGELFNPNTVLLGDIGNATIGRLIKPVKEMHEAYWDDPVLIHQEQTSQLGDRPIAPIRTRISPAGRVGHEVLATPDQYGATYVEPSASYLVSYERDENQEYTGSYVATDVGTNETIYVPAGVADDYTTEEAFVQARAPEPVHSQLKAVTNTATVPSYQAQISTQPRAMMDQEYAYKQEIMYRKMGRIKDPRDGSWRTQEFIENWTEPLGVYKWIVGDELVGRDPYTNETVIQRADAAYNASNRFWESELGSLGSQLSEIGRRFIRRDDGMLDVYNPIRNEMPNWLPGDNYFVNFQIGDAMSKVPHGERRLPGEGYESLNPLHSDETGRYGSFDKFKILADVAPWSDEYRFWNQYVLENEEDKDLRKEAVQIRKQVSKRKQKFDFQNYRFKDNDITLENVTVKKFLDDYTFLTNELGDQPIRLAGFEYRKKAEGVLQSYFQEGDEVTIGIAQDASQRIARDTYGTMRAVVYNELGNINQKIIERAEMVENENDFSAPGIYARFTPREIKKASIWEGLAHGSSPLNTKFLQVRTAVEEYERDQIYGKLFAA